MISLSPVNFNRACEPIFTASSAFFISPAVIRAAALTAVLAGAFLVAFIGDARVAVRFSAIEDTVIPDVGVFIREFEVAIDRRH